MKLSALKAQIAEFEKGREGLQNSLLKFMKMKTLLQERREQLTNQLRSLQIEKQKLMQSKETLDQVLAYLSEVELNSKMNFQPRK